MKHKSYIIIVSCIAALAFCAPPTASARTKKAAPDAGASPAAAPATSPAAKAPATTSPAPVKADHAIPFHGMISAVDAKARTFTIAGKEKSRTFSVTSTTVITKGGNAATMKDVVANEEVRGSYWKKTDNTLEAKTVKLGPKTEAEKAAAEAKSKKKTAASPSPAPKP